MIAARAVSAVIIAMVLLASGCSNGEGPAKESTEASAVVVSTDLDFYESEDGEVKRLDVYRPESGEDLPLVVLFHANPVFGGTKADVDQLATIVAGRGAVVVAPTYGDRVSMADMGLLAGHLLTWFRDQGACAVWAAVDLASSFGADPSGVIVVGDVTGIAPAQFATLDPPPAVPGCTAPPSEAPIDKAILFETDWFMVPDIWDQVIVDDPEWFAAITHWDELSKPTATRIHLLAGELGAANTVRSMEGDSYLESDWVRLRDPEGAFADAWASAGTLADDSMSFTDVTRVVTEVLVDAGWDADFAIVPGVAHSLSTDESKAFVANLVFDDQSD